jgi:hypothetical protein
VLSSVVGALVMAGVFGDEGAPPEGSSGDQLFPAAVIRAPERGTAAAAAAEIARQAQRERLRIARERAARRADGPNGAVPPTPASPQVAGAPASSLPSDSGSATSAAARSATGIPTPLP